MRREGRASIDVRREETLLIAQAERDAEDIRNGKKQLVSAESGLVVRELDAPVQASLDDVRGLMHGVSGRMLALRSTWCGF
jgi:hypothetical protein